MFLQTKRETLISLARFAALISISLLIASPRLAEGLPLGVDSPSHLFKVLYLYKTFTTHGYLPSWCSDWYGGTPFLHFYPPLTYLLTFFVALLGLGPLLAYKLVETFFYAIAPVSVYFLSRELGLNKAQSLFAGLSFSLTPIVIENFIFYDRFTTVISVPFLCLFLIAFMRALKSKKLSPLIFASFLLATLILIHHLSAYYLGIVVLFLAVTHYLKTKDAKNIAKKTVFIGAVPLLLSAFWLYPFISSALHISNPFYNRSVVDNFITPGIFFLVILTIGLSQLVFAILEVALHIFPSVRAVKRSRETFRLLFPSASIVIGSVVSYWVVEVGQFLVVLGFIAFSTSFLISMKGKEVEEADFIFCILWFLAFLWLGLGHYASLYRILPLAEKLDVLRFTFYLAIPQSILAGKFLGRVLSGSFTGKPSLSKTSLGRAMSPRILALCLVFVLFANLYLIKDVCNLTSFREFTVYEPHIPQKVVEFFSSAPRFARILPIRCPDWIYVLPYYVDKPIIDGWYPQEKLLTSLLEINDYQINTLNTYNKTKDRIRVWSNLIGNASQLGINWVMIGEPKLNSIMANYSRFEPVQSIGNLTIYESKPPVSLVEVNAEDAVGNISINYSSPGRIILRVSDVTRRVTVTVKEADFTGWRVLADGAPVEHSSNEDGFITFELEPGSTRLVRMEYEKQDFSPISLVTLLFLVVVLLAERTGVLRLRAPLKLA